MRIKTKIFSAALLLALALGCAEEKNAPPPQMQVLEAAPLEQEAAEAPISQAGTLAPEEEEAEAAAENGAVSAALPVAEPIMFTPLSGSERLAYSIQNVIDAEGWGQWNMTMYAVENDDTENAVALFSWEDMSWARVQFTGDFRTGFFLSRNTGNIFDLYMADGSVGEIRMLIAGISVFYRASKDGRFVGFVRGVSSSNLACIFLFDIESGAMAGEFEFRTREPVVSWQHIYRFGNVFRIYGVSEGGDIIAFAELDPVAMELRTVWDLTGDDWQSWLPDGLSHPPNVFLDEGWRDDVIDLLYDPNVMLRWGQ